MHSQTHTHKQGWEPPITIAHLSLWLWALQASVSERLLKLECEVHTRGLITTSYCNYSNCVLNLLAPFVLKARLKLSVMCTVVT